jgi:hypothetical protein
MESQILKTLQFAESLLESGNRDFRLELPIPVHQQETGPHGVLLWRKTADDGNTHHHFLAFREGKWVFKRLVFDRSNVLCEEGVEKEGDYDVVLDGVGLSVAKSSSESVDHGDTSASSVSCKVVQTLRVRGADASVVTHVSTKRPRSMSIEGEIDEGDVSSTLEDSEEEEEDDLKEYRPYSRKIADNRSMDKEARAEEERKRIEARLAHPLSNFINEVQQTSLYDTTRLVPKEPGGDPQVQVCIESGQVRDLMYGKGQNRPHTFHAERRGEEHPSDDWRLPVMMAAAALAVSYDALKDYFVDHIDKRSWKTTFANLRVILESSEEEEHVLSLTPSVRQVDELDGGGNIVRIYRNVKQAAACVGCSYKVMSGLLANALLAPNGLRSAWGSFWRYHPNTVYIDKKTDRVVPLRLRDGTFVEEHQVSEKGVVARKLGTPSQRQYKTYINDKDGYEYIIIHGEKRYIHVLVCTSFHGLPDSPDLVVMHKNRKKRDNRACNVRWATRGHVNTASHGKDVHIESRHGDVMYPSIKEAAKSMSEPVHKLRHQLKRSGDTMDYTRTDGVPFEAQVTRK